MRSDPSYQYLVPVRPRYYRRYDIRGACLRTSVRSKIRDRTKNLSASKPIRGAQIVGDDLIFRYDDTIQLAVARYPCATEGAKLPPYAHELYWDTKGT